MSLAVLWFCLIVVLWSGYLLLEGFDFGVGMLLAVLPRDERDRGAMLDVVGPVWDGNEVWLVVAAGATFAAFPAWYAALFSGFYVAILAILVLLVLRVVSFEWRGRRDGARWRSFWLWANVVGSAGVPFLWGVVLAGLLFGVPLDGQGDVTGGVGALLSVYGVATGLTLVLLCAFHGASFLSLRLAGALGVRVRAVARRLAVPAAGVGAVWLVWTVAVAVDRNDRDVLAPAVPAVLGGVALASAALLVRRGAGGRAFAAGSLAMILVVATLFTSLYPRVMVSSGDAGDSLTVSGAASAHYTLVVITVVALVILPVVLVYQAWTYRVFRTRVAGDDAPIAEEDLAATPRPEVA